MMRVKREDHVYTLGECNLLQAKKRGLRRNQSCCHLELRYLASRNVV